MQVESPRQIAVDVLLKHRDGEEFAEDLLEKRLSTVRLSGADRGLTQELVFGLVRWRRTLDWLIERKTEGRTQKLALQTLLELGLYQIFFLDRIPEHAAVFETVQLARRMNFGPQSGFINAVLRGYVREKEATRKQLENLKAENPALGYSHPDWLVERWSRRFGREKTLALLAWNNEVPPNYARLNALKAGRMELEEAWKEEKVSFERADLPSPIDASRVSVYRVRNHPPFSEWKSFLKGWFYFQDPSTLLPVQLMEPAPGESVLDLCAAPGGKTTLAAQWMNNRGSIMAQDASRIRLELVRENCERLGVTCVTISRPSDPVFPELSQPFDKVLLDVPCSNTGVIRRRVDLRWRLQPESLAPLAATQSELLEKAARQTRPGGLLVYSTCSLEPEENQERIAHFLAGHPEFEKTAEHQLLPFDQGVDGAYVARLVRRK